LLIHHFNGNVRAIAFALITADTSLLLQDLIHFERKDLNRTDLHTEQASLAIDLVPNDIQSRLHDL
jgi:hypothetical protein